MSLIRSLDNIIAVVVVLLVLSLIVQSIQSLFKKLFKIKSRQIEDSLIDLFENVLHASPTPATSSKSIFTSLWQRLVAVTGASPILRGLYNLISKMFRGQSHPADPSRHNDETVRNLYAAVLSGFRQVGRVSQSGKQMLDSVSKEDLQKVMGKVAPTILIPDFADRLAKVKTVVGTLGKTLQTVTDTHGDNLAGDANAKLALLRDKLVPLQHDLQALDDTTSPVLIEAITALRSGNLAEVLSLLGELQKKVADDPAGGTPELALALNKIASAVSDLHQNLDTLIAPLRRRLEAVEIWYDTVMQSFEERYTRGMKTWAVVISFLIVACLNASIVSIYKNIATNDMLRSQLLQAGEERLKLSEQKLSEARKTDDSKEEADILAQIRQDSEDIKTQIAAYENFGFKPLTLRDVQERFTPGLWKREGWLDRRKEDVKTLLGWLVMTALLSIGAPFWQDTLESLFGIKNLLRKRSDTKNVEDSSGGQPRS